MQSKNLENKENTNYKNTENDQNVERLTVEAEYLNSEENNSLEFIEFKKMIENKYNENLESPEKENKFVEKKNKSFKELDKEWEEHLKNMYKELAIRQKVELTDLEKFNNIC